jgi:hypothetical protein
MDTLEKKIKSIDFKKLYEQRCTGFQYTPSILPKVHRIIVIGDIHGDYKLTIDILKHSKVIEIKDDRIIWSGEDTHVVQVGDQIDKCKPLHNTSICSDQNETMNDEGSDGKILKLFSELQNQAVKSGGNVISLLGNHEILNIVGKMSYVSYLGLKEFEEYTNGKTKFNSGLDARKHAFSPGNEYGRLLGCTRNPSIIIGSNLFVHAGIMTSFMKELGITKRNDLEVINMGLRLWLMGILKKKYIRKIISSSHTSMFWNRILGSIPINVTLNDSRCLDNIDSVMKVLNINNIIIGHTPQPFVNSSGINSTCDEHVWRVDTGSSTTFDPFDPKYMSTKEKNIKRNPQYLEIIDDTNFKIYVL